MMIIYTFAVVLFLVKACVYASLEDCPADWEVDEEPPITGTRYYMSGYALEAYPTYTALVRDVGEARDRIFFLQKGRTCQSKQLKAMKKELTKTKKKLSTQTLKSEQLAKELEKIKEEQLDALEEEKTARKNENIELKGQLSAQNSKIQSQASSLTIIQNQLTQMTDKITRLENGYRSPEAMISFFAYGAHNPTSTGIVRFGSGSVKYNEGNGYSSSTGKFTVPKSGVYVINAMLQMEAPAVDNDCYAYLKLDGTVIAYWWKDAAMADEEWNFSMNVVVNLHKGNTVWVERTNKGQITADAQGTSFSGVMIYSI